MRRILHILKDADSASALAIIEAQARQGNCALHLLLIHEAARLKLHLPEAVPKSVKVDVLKDDYRAMLGLIFDADTIVVW